MSSVKSQPVHIWSEPAERDLIPATEDGEDQTRGKLELPASIPALISSSNITVQLNDNDKS